MQVVIVESPSKAQTINKYLGKDYKVLATFGHVRDLPPKDGSVNPDEDFAMLWEVDGKSSKHLSEIVKAAKEASRIILATDPDREGEAISWHVLEILKQRHAIKGKPVERVSFNAITESALKAAMSNPRQIDAPLVHAYLARRALDYLVGFNLSPVLWRKLPGARSAGRVQSVALRLICDREREIELFRTTEYWSLIATLKTERQQAFQARLVGADGKKITKLDIGSGEEAQKLRADLEKASFKVTGVEAKPYTRRPSAPFTTSTLQQEAARKLGFSVEHTMRLAQRLYEGIDIGGERTGLITYMRTDGVDMAGEAIAAARSVIAKEYGAKYVPGSPRKYTAKAKNAQEAHEAIRPTNLARLPKIVAAYLNDEQASLYELIWKRTLASQMESAEMERTTVSIEAQAGARKLDLRASGQVMLFDGFLALYQEGRDDAEDDESARLPAMKPGEGLTREKIEALQHFTEPPPRYSEQSLVARMEELGIGRPSTYGSTLAVLRNRDYVQLEKKRLIPQDKGRLVTAFLESFFNRYVSYDFTADLETQLDEISNDEIDWREVLRRFWDDFSAAIGNTKELRTTQVLDALNDILQPNIFPDKADGSQARACPSCGNGQLSLKLGKFGAFIGCSNYPECKYTRVFSGKDAENSDGDSADTGTKVLGKDPQTGEDVTLRDGRFGPFVQLGESDKPKRSSLPRGMRREEMQLEQALALLALPREVARHPTSGEPILAGLGRYGPYVQHGKTYASLGKDDDVLEIGGNRAIDLIVAKESGAGGSRFGRQASEAKSLGEHPDGGAITLRDGRYGPYVNHGKVNATLPKAIAPADITLTQALELLAAKSGSTPTKQTKTTKTAKSKATKVATTKSAAKKPAAKTKSAGRKTAGKKPPEQS